MMREFVTSFYQRIDYVHTLQVFLLVASIHGIPRGSGGKAGLNRISRDDVANIVLVSQDFENFSVSIDKARRFLTINGAYHTTKTVCPI